MSKEERVVFGYLTEAYVYNFCIVEKYSDKKTGEAQVSWKYLEERTGYGRSVLIPIVNKFSMQGIIRCRNINEERVAFIMMPLVNLVTD